MQCVYYDRRLPNGFEEHFPFSPEMPYTISIKSFPVEDIVPLHYAKTIEILLCEDLCGEIVIDNEHYLLGGSSSLSSRPYQEIFCGHSAGFRILPASLEQMGVVNREEMG